jgi:dephospho-CoA kinase
MKKPAIVVLTGASGAGKTTLLLKLEQLAIDGVDCINCDRVKVDVPISADQSDYQAAILKHWLTEIDERHPEVAVLDTQIRPHKARQVLQQMGMKTAEIILVDCDPAKRNARLRGERGQPELATAQMDCWAAYLRGQADAIGLPIIDTSEDDVDRSLAELLSQVSKMLPQKMPNTG